MSGASAPRVERRSPNRAWSKPVARTTQAPAPKPAASKPPPVVKVPAAKTAAVAGDDTEWHEF
jgi:hypothetical protein